MLALEPITNIYKPAEKLGTNVTVAGFLSPILVNIITFTGVFAFFVILFAGFQYITSGGDKGKVAQAQNTLNYAIIGIVVVAAAFLITNIVSAVTGFNFLKPN